MSPSLQWSRSSCTLGSHTRSDTHPANDIEAGVHQYGHENERARTVKPDLKMGVCGEHGGDPASIALFADLGLDYVSCSPFRVPVARLAAAQAAIAMGERDK